MKTVLFEKTTILYDFLKNPQWISSDVSVYGNLMIETKQKGDIRYDVGLFWFITEREFLQLKLSCIEKYFKEHFSFVATNNNKIFGCVLGSISFLSVTPKRYWMKKKKYNNRVMERILEFKYIYKNYFYFDTKKFIHKFIEFKKDLDIERVRILIIEKDTY